MPEALEEILEVVKARGLEIVLNDDNQPVVRGPAQERTQALMQALKAYRGEIKTWLEGRLPKARQWKWRDGHTYTEAADDSFFGNLEHHPAGAWWWRWRGELEWQVIPEREPFLRLYSEETRSRSSTSLPTSPSNPPSGSGQKENRCGWGRFSPR